MQEERGGLVSFVPPWPHVAISLSFFHFDQKQNSAALPASPRARAIERTRLTLRLTFKNDTEKKINLVCLGHLAVHEPTIPFSFFSNKPSQREKKRSKCWSTRTSSVQEKPSWVLTKCRRAEIYPVPSWTGFCSARLYCVKTQLVFLQLDCSLLRLNCFFSSSTILC